MIGTLVRRDWLELSRSPRWWLLIGIVALLGALSAATAWDAARQYEREVAAASAADLRNFEQQGAKNPHAAAHFGQYAFRPAGPLAFFDPGVSAYTGAVIWLEAHRMNLGELRAAEEADPASRAAQLTPAWLFQVAVPLLLLVLLAPAVAGERERGTLALVLSQSVRLNRVVVAKVLTAASAAVLAALPVGAGLAVAAAGGTSDVAWRTAALAGVYGLYWLAIAAIALGVSALASSRRQAVAILVGVWVVWMVVLPRVAVGVAERLAPAPHAAEFWAAVKADQDAGPDGHSPAEVRRKALERQLLARYGVANVDELPVNFTAVFLQSLEEHGNAVFDRRYGELWDTWDRQQRVRSWFGVASPYLTVRHLSMGLAGTDDVHVRDFTRAAERHRRELVHALHEHQARAGAKQRFFVADPSLWASMPRFDYAPPSLRSIAARYRLDALLLVLWAAAAVLFAAYAARTAEREP